MSCWRHACHVPMVASLALLWTVSECDARAMHAKHPRLHHVHYRGLWASVLLMHACHIPIVASCTLPWTMCELAYVAKHITFQGLQCVHYRGRCVLKMLGPCMPHTHGCITCTTVDYERVRCWCHACHAPRVASCALLWTVSECAFDAKHATHLGLHHVHFRGLQRV